MLGLTSSPDIDQNRNTRTFLYGTFALCKQADLL